MMSQGSSEVSIMFVVQKDQEKLLSNAYQAFFGESKKTKHGTISQQGH